MVKVTDFVPACAASHAASAAAFPECLCQLNSDAGYSAVTSSLSRITRADATVEFTPFAIRFQLEKTIISTLPELSSTPSISVIQHLSNLYAYK